MGQTFLAQLGAAFGAGVLSSLSPCVYPMIPISLGYLGSQKGDGQKRAVLAFFIGQVLTFTGMGIVAVKMGEVFGFSNDLKWVNLGIGTLLITFGLFSFKSYLPGVAHKWNNIGDKINSFGLTGMPMAFLIGVSSGLLASPCTGPILGSVLLTLSQNATFNQGLMMMLSYALGLSLIFLALGLGLMKLEKMPRAGNWMNWVHRMSSGLIVIAGIYYLYIGATSSV